MNHKKGWGVTALVVAFVLVAGGLLIRLAIYPGQLQFPDDVDVTRNYEGDLAVMMNPAALETGDLANLFLTDVPVTLARNVRTLEVGGDGDAIVLEAASMAGPTGPLAATEDVYAIDRKTMEAVENFSDDDRVVSRQGLVIGWPIDTEQQDYVGWNGDTLATVTLAYEGEEERGGIDTYRFTAAGEPALIVDPAMLATLPPALPKELLGQLGATLGLSDEQAAQFGQLLEVMPDPVPIAYTYGFDKTYWVEPTTGVLVDVDVSETRAAVIQAPDGSIVPLAAIQQLHYVNTDASVQDAVDDANGATSLMLMFGVVVPLGAIVLGLVLGGIGIWLLRKRSDGMPVKTTTPERELQNV
jgi:Porin PorA